MPTAICAAARCGRPVDDAFLCQGCVDQLRVHLAKLAGDPGRATLVDPGPDYARDRVLPAPDRGLLADLELTMARQDRADPDTARPAEQLDEPDREQTDRPIATQPLPLRPGAAAALGTARNLLSTWVRDLIHTRYGSDIDALRRTREYRTGRFVPRVVGHADALGPAHGPFKPGPRFPGDHPAEMAEWLGLHVASIAQDEGAGEIADGCARLVDTAQRIVAPPPLSYLGWCEHCARVEDVAVDLYVPNDAEAGECPRCRTSFDVAERRRERLDAAADRWVSAHLATQALQAWVRDVRTVRDDDGNIIGDPKPLTVAAIEGLESRGRLACWRPTDAELAAARAQDRPRPVRRYLLGEIMQRVEEQQAEAEARHRRNDLRARQRRRTPPPEPRAEAC